MENVNQNSALPTNPSATDDRHFATDHLRKDLRLRSIQGGRISLLSQIAKFIITLGTMAVMARILSPAEFGIVAMVMAFTHIAASFRDMGLTTATIQSSTVDHLQVSTLFWINVLFGAFLCLVVVAASPFIALFYGDPRITAIAAVFSFSFIIAGLGAQHQAILRRQMRFTALSAIVVSASILSSLVAIGAALKGAGYWALVAMHLTLEMSITVGAWIACRWKPGAPARVKGVRPLLSFGGHLAGVSLIASLTRVVDKVLVGYASGAGQAGLYSRSYNLLVIPLTQTAQPITNVAVAAMSRLRSDAGAYRSFYRKGAVIFLSLTVPFVAFSFVSAESLVYTLLGDQWTDSIPLVRLLAPAAFITTIRPTIIWIYLSNGQSRRQFLWSLCSFPVVILSLAAGMKWGATGIAIAFSSALVVTGLPELPYCFRYTPLTISDYLSVLWRPVLSSILAAVVLYAAIVFFTGGMVYWICLLVNLFLFYIVYSICWLVFPGGIAMIRDFLGRR